MVQVTFTCLRAVDENEGLRPDLTVFNDPNYSAPLLVDISVVQSFPGSKNPYNDKVNKYQRACNTNGASFLPFIMESNGQLPSYFLKI